MKGSLLASLWAFRQSLESLNSTNPYLFEKPVAKSLTRLTLFSLPYLLNSYERKRLWPYSCISEKENYFIKVFFSDVLMQPGNKKC